MLSLNNRFNIVWLAFDIKSQSIDEIYIYYWSFLLSKNLESEYRQEHKTIGL